MATDAAGGSGKGDRRDRLPAVGWMGGPDVLSRLGVILREAQRPNGWMNVPAGFIHDECDHRDGRLTGLASVVDQRDERAHIEADTAHRRGMAGPPAVEPPGATAEDFWFDYIADIGDDTDAMYAVAYACQVDLAASESTEPRVDARLVAAPSNPRGFVLPRGQFLFVGGDTAYHVADTVTLRRRVADPFNWAHEDLKLANEPKRRIYGIPGNHDWYDHLEGFAKVFRREHKESIELRGFEAVQLASYLAIQLPNDWQLWGLDIYLGLDANQQAYFESLRETTEPKRLVLCTPSPPIAFHALHEVKHHNSSLTSLGLALPYETGLVPSKGCSRLDLSGDIHHYARYQNGDKSSYAAVVSGLGGVFHHPTFTSRGEGEDSIPAQKEYPPADVSLEAVGSRLFLPWTLVEGSWFRALPVAVGSLLGLAAVQSPGAQWLLSRVLASLPSAAAPSIPAGNFDDFARSLAVTGLILAIAGLLALAGWLFIRHSRVHAEDPSKRVGVSAGLLDYLRRRPGMGLGYWPSTLLIVTSAILIGIYPLASFAPASRHTALDVATILVSMALLIAGPVLGYKYGASGLGTSKRLLIGGIGLLHAVMQLLTPLVFALCVAVTSASLLLAAASAAATLVVLWSSRHLYKKRAPLTAGLTLLWVAVWLGALSAVAFGAEGDTVASKEVVWRSLGVALGALVSLILGTSYFAWYLAVTSLLDGHNNEVGGAARVSRFRQLIRFRVNSSGLTGFVIAVNNTPGVETIADKKRPVENLQLKLVDVFRVDPDI